MANNLVKEKLKVETFLSGLILDRLSQDLLARGLYCAFPIFPLGSYNEVWALRF